MDPKNFTIGILSTTAVILLVGLLLICTRPEPVLASGMTASGGNYVMTVGLDASGDEEFVYVVDVSVSRLIAYRFDAGRQKINIVQGIDLGELRQATERSQPSRNAPSSRQRRGRTRP